MKLKYKILFIIILFFILFSLNTYTVKAVTIRDLDCSENQNGSLFMQAIKNSEEYKSGNYYVLAYNTGNTAYNGDVYFIDKSLDFKLYLTYDWASYYRFTFSSPTNVRHYSLNKYQSGRNYMDSFEEKSVTYCINFDFNGSLNLYSEIDIYTDNTFTNYFYEANKFELVLENLYFVETLEGYYLQTDKLNYDNYIDYDMYLYDEDNNLWSKENVIKDFVSDYYYDENGTAIFTTAIQYKYEVLNTGVFTFRLQHNSEDITSNSYTYTITDFNIADRMIYDIYEPYYTYDYDGGNAIVYTNYLDVKYYDTVSLYYYNENDDYDKWSLFSSSIMSKEYNKDKTQFRFKLKFSEPVSHSCRFIVSGFGDYGLYYSDISSFTITQEFFDNKGYEEQGLLSRIGDFLKDFFVGLFVPKEGYIENKVSDLGDKLNTKIPYQQYIEDFEQLSELEVDFKDIVVGADLGEYTITEGLIVEKKGFLDFSIFTKYQDVWFSWVRLVFYIGLIIFNINMLMKFLRGFTIADGRFVATGEIKK